MTKPIEFTVGEYGEQNKKGNKMNHMGHKKYKKFKRVESSDKRRKVEPRKPVPNGMSIKYKYPFIKLEKPGQSFTFTGDARQIVAVRVAACKFARRWGLKISAKMIDGCHNKLKIKREK